MSGAIKVGIIGAHVASQGSSGSWGVRAHLPALRALVGFEAFAVATTSKATAQEVASQFGVKNAYGNYDQLVENPDIDIVVICVRVSKHFELVSAAIAAGKHVYCEWPFALNTDDAVKLADMAERAGVLHFIGLQGRRSPTVDYVRDLLDNGEMGRVNACVLNHSVPWPVAPSANYVYLQKRESGANFLTIAGGHNIDTVMDLFGEFKSLAAVARTQMTHVYSPDNIETLRTSFDQVLISAVTNKDVVASLRFQGNSEYGTGISLEINCEKGDLLITPANGSARMLQMTDLRLQRATALGQFEDVRIPDRYNSLPEAIRTGMPLNVARSYLAVGDSLRGRPSVAPNFGAAVSLHKTLDRIEAASANFG